MNKPPRLGGLALVMLFSGAALIGGIVVVNMSERNKAIETRARARRGGRRAKLPG